MESDSVKRETKWKNNSDCKWLDTFFLNFASREGKLIRTCAFLLVKMGH